MCFINKIGCSLQWDHDCCCLTSDDIPQYQSPSWLSSSSSDHRPSSGLSDPPLATKSCTGERIEGNVIPGVNLEFQLVGRTLTLWGNRWMDGWMNGEESRNHSGEMDRSAARKFHIILACAVALPPSTTTT